MSTPALQLDGLHKSFGRQVAVDHVSLNIPAGSCFGMVGPNGAGKTTLLSMATGLLRPDAGTARIFGIDVWAAAEQAKALVGVLPDGLGMPEQLTGSEVLTYLGLLRGLPEEVVGRRRTDLLTVLDLPQGRDKLVIEYSTGMRKKLGLAVALLHAPRLLVLDEPLEAVDPVSAGTIRGILDEFVAGGGSVVISSHVMPVVEQLCDRVAVVDGGRVLVSGRTSEVRAGRALEEVFVDLVGTAEGTRGGLPWLSP